MSKFHLSYILASIPESIVLVKRNIDMYNEPGAHQVQPEPAGHRKETR